MNGNIFNIQRFSLFDGPGVRTVVFFKGCPLRCIWCHNPEGLNSKPEIMYLASKCIGCGECAKVCERNCHVFTEDGLHGLKRQSCISCGRCAAVCAAEALSVAGKTVSAEKVMAEVMRDSALYKESGGGLTLSGGEPLIQADFALELLKLAKEHGISTCVETCGHVPTETFEKAAPYVDVFYYDYKATGDEQHKKLCGKDQKLILKNLSVLCESGANVVLRCPIVPGANETEEHIRGIAETAKKYSCISEVQLEPYHRMGISKSERLGISDPFDTEDPDRSDLEEYCKEISDISAKNCIIN